MRTFLVLLVLSASFGVQAQKFLTIRELEQVCALPEAQADTFLVNRQYLFAAKWDSVGKRYGASRLGAGVIKFFYAYKVTYFFRAKGLLDQMGSVLKINDYTATQQTARSVQFNNPNFVFVLTDFSTDSAASFQVDVYKNTGLAPAAPAIPRLSVAEMEALVSYKVPSFRKFMLSKGYTPVGSSNDTTRFNARYGSEYSETLSFSEGDRYLPGTYLFYNFPAEELYRQYLTLFTSKGYKQTLSKHTAVDPYPSYRVTLTNGKYVVHFSRQVRPDKFAISIKAVGK